MVVSQLFKFESVILALAVIVDLSSGIVQTINHEVYQNNVSCKISCCWVEKLFRILLRAHDRALYDSSCLNLL